MSSTIKTLSFILLLAFFLSVVPLSTEAASSPHTKVTLFKASKSKIEAGKSVTLKWKAKNAANCQIRIDTDSNGLLFVDHLSSSGSYVVNPTRTEKYLIYCTQLGKNGAVYSDQKTVTVKVKNPTSSKTSIINTFTVSPSRVVFDEPATVKLVATGVYSCDLTAYNDLTNKVIGDMADFVSNGTGSIDTSFQIDPTLGMKPGTTIKTRYEAVCRALGSDKKETKTVTLTGVR